MISKSWNGHSEFITENEYGRGMAQVVSSKNDKEEIVYTIVIDKNLIFHLLVGEEQLEAVKNNFNSQEDYDPSIYFNKTVSYQHFYIMSLPPVCEYSLNRAHSMDPEFRTKSRFTFQLVILARQCWSGIFLPRWWDSFKIISF